MHEIKITLYFSLKPKLLKMKKYLLRSNKSDKISKFTKLSPTKLFLLEVNFTKIIIILALTKSVNKIIIFSN